MKVCSRCQIEKKDDDFPLNGKRRHSWCKQCHREVVREKYINNRNWINSLKDKCSICGYCRNVGALEWHHKNKDKEFNINQLSKRAITNKEKVLKEISKCILVCSNCHREIHYPQLNKEKI